MDAPRPKTVVFSHIPKSAGTSVTGALQRALQPERAVYYLDFSLVGGYDDTSQVNEKALSRFVFSPEELPDADYVSGHISPGTTMVRYPDAPHVVILRNPETRMISQWVHGRSLTETQMRHWGPAYAFRVARFPLARYLNHANIAPNVDNTITRFLTWPHPALAPDRFIEPGDDETLFEAAVTRLDSFLHANVVENKNFLDELGAALGVTLTDERLNDRSANPPVVPTDLGTELDGSTRELLDHRNRIDLRIWKHVAEQVLPDADLDAVLDAGLQDSIRRYSALPAAPPPDGLVRRTAEWAFRTKARLDPRLRAYR